MSMRKGYQRVYFEMQGGDEEAFVGLPREDKRGFGARHEMYCINIASIKT